MRIRKLLLLLLTSFCISNLPIGRNYFHSLENRIISDLAVAESRRQSTSPKPFRIVELKTSTEAITKYQALQVPIISYSREAKNGGIDRVDFVGAIHLAEAEYYRALNKVFHSYDAVLYELVADREALPNQEVINAREKYPVGSNKIEQDHPSNPVRLIQGTLAKILGLQFQLEGINYHARNFVHADLSPSELSAAMRSRGESVPSILLKLFKLQSSKSTEDKIKQPTTVKEGFVALDSIDPLKLLLIGPSPAEQRALRAYLAEGIISSEDLFRALQDDGGLALIDDRNAAIVKVMYEQFNRGHQDLAIFYGVGHLHDLHHRLTANEGFKIDTIKWLDAWVF